MTEWGQKKRRFFSPEAFSHFSHTIDVNTSSTARLIYSTQTKTALLENGVLTWMGASDDNELITLGERKKMNTPLWFSALISYLPFLGRRQHDNVIVPRVLSLS